MRDILFKNLTSKDNRRHDIFISESHHANGKLFHSEKRYIYLIHGVKEFASFAEMNKFFSDANNDSLVRIKDIKITKIHNTPSGMDKIFCKIIGNFYAIYETKIFLLSFIHLFSVETTLDKMAHSI